MPLPTPHLEETGLLDLPSNRSVPIIRGDPRGYGVSEAAMRSMWIRKLDKCPRPGTDLDEAFQSDDSAILDVRVDV